MITSTHEPQFGLASVQNQPRTFTRATKTKRERDSLSFPCQSNKQKLSISRAVLGHCAQTLANIRMYWCALTFVRESPFVSRRISWFGHEIQADEESLRHRGTEGGRGRESEIFLVLNFTSSIIILGYLGSRTKTFAQPTRGGKPDYTSSKLRCKKKKKSMHRVKMNKNRNFHRFIHAINSSTSDSSWKKKKTKLLNHPAKWKLDVSDIDIWQTMHEIDLDKLVQKNRCKNVIISLCVISSATIVSVPLLFLISFYTIVSPTRVALFCISMHIKIGFLRECLTRRFYRVVHRVGSNSNQLFMRLIPSDRTFPHRSSRKSIAARTQSNRS